MKKWRGRVLISMTAIGDGLDVLASLVGTQRLLYALVDEPEEVARLCREVYAVWLEVYNEFSSILAENNPAYVDWPGLLAAKPMYTPQCDFCYMIGPDMFDEFVLPYLKRTSELFAHTLYHLDGKGELIHLDKILQIDTMEAVQWQPGDGAGYGYRWIDVYRRIRRAGKRMHFIGSQSDFIEVTNDVGAEGRTERRRRWMISSLPSIPDPSIAHPAERKLPITHTDTGRYPTCISHPTIGQKPLKYTNRGGRAS